MVANNSWSGAAAFVLFSFLPTTLLAQGSWSQTPIQGQVPQLGAHAAAYDLGNHHTLVFGGFGPTYAIHGGTWRFDGITWMAMISATEPSGRAGHAMAYDSVRGQIVLFGGVESHLASPGTDDTWEHNGMVWTERTSTPSPSRRFDHAMCYDMARGKVVLYGGRVNSYALFGDTWEWDGTSWTDMSATAPGPRFNHAMCYDLARTRTVMFGGFSSGSLGDTWQWDGASWQQAQPVNSPLPCSGHAMAYDTLRSVSVLHGGIPNGSETWEWDGTDWTQHGTTFLEKYDHVLVFDEQLGRSTLIGGTVQSHPISFASDLETYGHPPSGSYVSHGTSCSSSGSTPQLFSPTSVWPGPMIGEASVLQVMPTWFHAFFVFGWSDTVEGSHQLPLNLSNYGMPGCTLQVSRDVITSAIPTNGVATINVPIPNNPFMVGVRFFVQGFSLDLGPNANPGGFATTNRLEGIVGRT